MYVLLKLGSKGAVAGRSLWALLIISVSTWRFGCLTLVLLII